jgi:hypothetical protein
VCVDENNLYDTASHKSNPLSVPWGIMDSYSIVHWVIWEAVTIVEGIYEGCYDTGWLMGLWSTQAKVEAC